MEPADVAIDPQFASILENLAKSNSFTMEELAENRAGRMSRRQRRRSIRWLIKYSLPLALYIGPSLAFLVAAVVHASDRESHVVFGLILLGLSTQRFLCIAGLLRDMREASAASVEGPGVAFNNGSKSLPRSYYVIGGKRFRVDIDADQTLARGVYYRAYYAPHAGNLLSIEPLRRREPRQKVASQGERSDGAAQGQSGDS